MSQELRRLWRWLERARPPRRALWRALGASLVASIANVGLFVGAVALLVTSATRPGLTAVLGALIVIELLAFLRSPLRFSERLSAHQLGFSAVTKWRSWLVRTVGSWDYARWRSYATGDLLERALRDTDELQDLWLRCVLPLVTVVTTMVVSDLALLLFAPRGHWWPDALGFFVIQVLGVSYVTSRLGPLVRRDRHLRHARAKYQNALIEFGALGPEAHLLGVNAFIAQRLGEFEGETSHAEAALRRERRPLFVTALAAPLASLALVAWRHPHSAATWSVVVALVAVSVLEGFSTLRNALDTAVAVSAAAERLEELDEVHRARSLAWPGDEALRANNVIVREGTRTLFAPLSFSCERGERLAITGPSGVGKSTLLRVLAGLDEPASGRVDIGPAPLRDLEEATLRQHLAYVPSEPGLMRGYVRDVLGLGRPSDLDVVALLHQLGINAEPSDRWEELSRGERARVALARALLTRPSFVLLDEPTSGLGHDETARVLRVLEESGAGVVVATHDPQVLTWCSSQLELETAAEFGVNR